MILFPKSSSHEDIARQLRESVMRFILGSVTATTTARGGGYDIGADLSEASLSGDDLFGYDANEAYSDSDSEPANSEGELGNTQLALEVSLHICSNPFMMGHSRTGQIIC